ncbi:LysR substrate-binding domain-containing protein [Pseudoroseicyclus tamaricis]|uniref:LysR family transcriptional regulator n=1 Tax=Pseudoroseicyclus tamaricis TaxID=2705421 RepID=A0A6B2JM45_9RHOB|nr:LysR substrate-binding domain-containing protein [Pseudoroseicyclus tamaricis]NDV02651.1 LysR family transcriptional regulator [Pseudoroseicyclus tamaricis]
MLAPDWHRLPSLSSLRAFEATVRLGSFTAAAQALNVTQPAVAQQVRGLEAELGVALVHRAGRGLAVTEAGAALARDLAEGFSAIARGVDALQRSEARRGLRISAAPAFSQTVLMPLLGAFWQAHPDIPVSLEPGTAIVDMARTGIDLTIRSGSGEWPDVLPHHLAHSRFIVAATPELLAQEDDLANLPWLLTDRDPFELAWLRDAGYDLDTLDTRHIDNPMLAVSAARASYGLIFATEIVLVEDLAAGRMREVPFPGLPQTDYWACLPHGPARPAAMAFVRWLRAHFAPLAQGRVAG